MFKAALSEEWPAHWKRIRYSQNWPKTPEVKPERVYILLTQKNWNEAAKERAQWICENDQVYELAKHHLGNIIRSANG